MTTENTICIVKNRSTSTVCYTIPEDNIRRTFAPGESKKITYGELVKLTFQPGGRELLQNFLQAQKEEIVKDLCGRNTPPEYYISERQIIDLLLHRPLDEFLDCLDYAPIGVIDLIKKLAVDLPLTDFEKRKALTAKTGFDVDKAIQHQEESKEPEEKAFTTSNSVSTPTTSNVPAGRRTKVTYKAPETEEVSG